MLCRPAYLKNFSARLGALTVLGAVLALFVLNNPAFADDPFDMEGSNWMSFDRYKEKPSNWIAPDRRAQVEQVPVVAPPPTMPADMPAITAPSRPLEPAIMPGFNKDFDIRVNSTADDNQLPDPKIQETAAGPTVELDNKGWKNAFTVAHRFKSAKMGDDEDATTSLDIRFAFLPAITGPQKKVIAPQSLIKKAEAATPKPALPVVVAPPPADPAACAAIDAYKKRQLAAIESDRRTLAALQNAIAQLGLQKQLDFMTGANGAVNAETAGAQNMPAALSRPAGKN